MKKSVILLFFAFIIVSASVFLPLRPTIVVKNESSENLYLHVDEVPNGIEPNPEEVDKIVKSKPDVIEPGATIKLTTSFNSLIRNDLEFNIGWLIGGRYSYNAIGSGGRNFIIISNKGECTFSLTVRDGYNNYELNSQKSGFCITRLSPIP